MAQILVRNLDAKVVTALKARARRAGRSLQSEVKEILDREAKAPRLDMTAARELALSIRRKFKPGRAPDSVALIRKGRDR